MTLKSIIADFKAAPVAVKPATVMPSPVTRVQSREEFRRAMTNGARDSRQ